MKKFVLIFLILVINCYGQDSSKTGEDSLKSKYAIDIIFLNEQSLSFRYHFSDNFYWKIGADLSANFSDGEYFYKSGSSDATERSFGLRLNNQIYFPFYKNNFMSLDYGTGPSLYYAKEISNSHYNDKDQKRRVDETTFEYGIINSIGAEINISRSIFLLFKYDYLISFGSNNIKYTDTSDSVESERTNKRDYLNLKLSNIKIGIGINL